ncbi:hypothetical protein LSH36_447g04000 [Paralvinella palmiformis]|uniref:Uncharacterized protein n=1 Tax=Paralvinella palmiformis TaxID=53620 RepID=A0AAD9JB21_9ANNE|nr:hypothetical protein LSH36_447g04000 [Paralvinella palmiformis]
MTARSDSWVLNCVSGPTSSCIRFGAAAQLEASCPSMILELFTPARSPSFSGSRDITYVDIPQFFSPHIFPPPPQTALWIRINDVNDVR